MHPIWEETAMGKKDEPGKNVPKLEDNKILKRVAAVLLVVASAVAVVILLLALVNQTGDNNGGTVEGDFVVKLDNADTASNHFRIGTKPGTGDDQEDPDVKTANDGTKVLLGEALGNAWPTSNAVVRAHYNDLIKEKGLNGGLSGSANFKDEVTNQPAALIYTFYLTNVSDTESQTFRFAARLSHNRGQSANSTGVDAYEYVRFGVFMGNNGSEDDDVRYFANRTMSSTGLKSDPNDYRECLSNYTILYDEKGNPYREPTYSDKFADTQEVSICEPFEPDSDPAYADRGLFDLQNLEIAPGKSRRITFIAYLEGADPDCHGSAPTNQKLGFSLHVGL